MKKAFTLIELLVVIAIIAILAAILFPVFAQAKTAAKASADLSNLKQIGVSLQLYLADSDDVYGQAYYYNNDNDSSGVTLSGLARFSRTQRTFRSLSAPSIRRAVWLQPTSSATTSATALPPVKSRSTTCKTIRLLVSAMLRTASSLPESDDQSTR